MSFPKTELGYYRRRALLRGLLKLEGKVLLTMIRSNIRMRDHPDNQIYEALDECAKKINNIIE